jgi:HSP20 family protein
MTLIHWQTLPEFETVRRQMERFVDELAPNYEALVKRVDVDWTPAIELETQPDAFILRAQLPGIDAATVDVQVSRHGVSISGERKSIAADTGYIRSEFRYGKFHRVVALAAPVQNDQVRAHYADGILTLTLPREQAVRPNVVKVNITGETPAGADAADAAEPTA